VEQLLRKGDEKNIRYIDPAPNFEISVLSQRFYNRHSIPTRVLPASLTSIQDCLKLAGADYITISPPLLHELAATTPAPSQDLQVPSLFDTLPDHSKASSAENAVEDLTTIVIRSSGSDWIPFDWRRNEAVWREAMLASANGQHEEKLREAIGLFCGFQKRIELLVERYLK
jgi:transaldolase